MRYTFLVTVTFLVCFQFSTRGEENMPDGTDLFIESVRCRTENHTLVHSLSYVTEQIYRTSVLSKDEIDKKVEEHMTLLREGLKNNPNAHYWLDGSEEAAREHYMKTEVLSRLTVKYKAPNFTHKLLFLQVERAGNSPTKWETEVNVIDGKVFTSKSTSEGVTWFPRNRSARINNTSAYMETLLNFGRLQGPPVKFMHLLLFQDTDLEKYEFSETNIGKFKAERDKQLKSGKAKGLITIGTATYDDNAKAYIVESSIGSQVIERYWIDVNRGYVCPLLQYYNEKGKLISEYKAENYFKHEKSGLWFPQLYKEMTTNREGKQEFKEYRIDKASLDVNFPITDEEFAIEIPEGAEVIDERKGKKSARYRAIDKGVLSLGKDGLDLQKKDWLASMDIFSVSSSTSLSFYVRFTFMAVGALLILYGLFGRFIRKKK